jgi:hypothetical protein
VITATTPSKTCDAVWRHGGGRHRHPASLIIIRTRSQRRNSSPWSREHSSHRVTHRPRHRRGVVGYAPVLRLVVRCAGDGANPPYVLRPRQDRNIGRGGVAPRRRRVRALGLHKPTRFALSLQSRMLLPWCVEYFVAPSYLAQCGIIAGSLTVEQSTGSRNALPHGTKTLQARGVSFPPHRHGFPDSLAENLPLRRIEGGRCRHMALYSCVA